MDIQRYFFHIAFNGNQYRGWQRQSSAVSVQDVIEKCLSNVLKQPVYICGCGRTDAQVHASQYVFHADIVGQFDYDLVKRLNFNLPKDITIFEIVPVPAHAHARYDAVQRTYDYFIHLRKNPYLVEASAYYAIYDLDLKAMSQAVGLLTQYNDYYTFCKSPDSFEHTKCHVSNAQLWVSPNGDRLRFQISANRFLTNMVRIIVYRLLQVGSRQINIARAPEIESPGQRILRENLSQSGDELNRMGASEKQQMTLTEFRNLLDRTFIPPNKITCAHPQGLYLSKIEYPYLQLPQNSDFAAVFQHENENYWHTID